VSENPSSAKQPSRTVSGVVQVLDIKAAQPTSKALAGLTFAVKDMFDVAGETAGFGCPDWKSSHSLAKENAAALETLLDNGAHLKANAVCDELAFSLDGINVHYGIPLNPLAPASIPGGSSSGPASVVAQGLFDFALGTDTAGSTRVPASYCGLWGLRPSHGAISLAGVLPLGPSFDTVGILARDLDVLTKVAHVLIAPADIDQADAKSTTKIEPPTTLLVVSECMALLNAELLPPVMAMIDKFRRRFKHSREETVIEDGLAALVSNFAAIRALEAWQCHSHWYESCKPNLSPAVAKRFLACAAATESEAEKSRVYRRQMQEQLAKILEDSVLCLPTTAQLPPLLSAGDEELESNRSLNLRLNSIASFLGLPQITIPIVDDQLGPLPLGLSLIGKCGSEKTLLNLAKTLTK